MKLRLRNDTVRIRLTRSEVDALAQGQPVESATRFGSGQALGYRVAPEGAEPAARFVSGVLTISLPAAAVTTWAASNDIVFAAEQKWDGGSLRISVEKDLACVKPREGESDADAFPATLGAPHCN